MENNLFPDGYDYESVDPAALSGKSAIGYRNGISFDALNGEFMRDSMNKLIDSDGIESWKSWCINCIMTERYKHLAYSSDFGIELDAIFAAESREESESILIRQITEAIMADPYQRTAYIENVKVVWTHPDTIAVNVIVRGIDDVTIDITAYITKREV